MYISIAEKVEKNPYFCMFFDDVHDFGLLIWMIAAMFEFNNSSTLW